MFAELCNILKEIVQSISDFIYKVNLSVSIKADFVVSSTPANLNIKADRVRGPNFASIVGDFGFECATNGLHLNLINSR